MDLLAVLDRVNAAHPWSHNDAFEGVPGVVVEQRIFGDEPPQAYDLVVFVASLHHMPLHATLLEAKRALRPGGRIVVVGVARDPGAHGWRSRVSLVLNPVVGLVRHPVRATAYPAHMRAPVTPPTDTFDEIRAVVREVLPGVRMRRRLFWRYTADWVASGML